MKVLNKVNNRPYAIICSNHFGELKQAVSACCNPSSICIVTDSHVGPIYLETIKAICEEIAPTYAYVFEAGEESKHLDTVTAIYDTLLEHQADRSSLIIALGGGVTGDIAGFAASTYMRGIPFIQIPTTTVAQNDSSIGGKVGVDYFKYKNIVGAFHNPLLVYININTLKSLPKKELIGGIGEVIKHGLIYDAALFHFLWDNVEAILEVNEDVVEQMTYQSVKVKCEVVEQDLKELGLRKILNFGHTVGHAIETLSEFKYSHGECVAFGMCAAAYISFKRQLISFDVVEQIIKLGRMFGLLQPIDDYHVSDVWRYMSYDKKRAYGKIAFILLKNIGETIIVTDVSEKEITDAIEFLKQTCH